MRVKIRYIYFLLTIPLILLAFGTLLHIAQLDGRSSHDSVTHSPRASARPFLAQPHVYPNLLGGKPSRLKYEVEIPDDAADLYTVDKPSPWQLWHNDIRPSRLYNPRKEYLAGVIHDLQTATITALEEPDSGTQLKFILTLDNDAEVMMKPMRRTRDRAFADENQFYFSMFEFHHGEIAAFHLDMVLGFYRVPPTVGRILNITSDIEAHAPKKVKKTIFTSPGGNKCFHGTCDYYCDTGHAACGNASLHGRDQIEVSIQAFLPSKNDLARKFFKHPYRRSYSKRSKASWETDNFFCDGVHEEYGKSRRMLDFVDLAVFDYLMGNQDRHHFEFFTGFGNESSLVYLDNGRGFGRPYVDDITILIPLYQCCLMRNSTLHKLMEFNTGEKLSSRMVRSMAGDRLAPILTQVHLDALDRRVPIILKTVSKCVDSNSYKLVIIEDGF